MATHIRGKITDPVLAQFQKLLNRAQKHIDGAVKRQNSSQKSVYDEHRESAFEKGYDGLDSWLSNVEQNAETNPLNQDLRRIYDDFQRDANTILEKMRNRLRI